MRAVIFFLTGLVACALANKNYKVVCYFGGWSVYRTGGGQFNISDIDASLCTHLIYTFVGVTDDGDLKILDSWADLADNYGKGGYKKFNALRNANPNVKTMIAMGGWNEGSQRYSEVVSHPEKRKRFVKSVLEFIKKHDFNGFDLDWEYPNQRGGKSTDKENYVSLLRELSMAFQEKKLILSAAVAAAETSASKSYLIAKVTKYLDFINVMTYDLHGKWENTTGINAPLYAGSWEKGEARGLNVEASVKYWISQGAEPKKLVLGVPFYGRSFRLDDPSMNGVGAPSNQQPEGGPYTREPGFLGYNEICEYLKAGTWQKVFQEEQRVPYAYKGNQWVGYDDERSLEEKANYVKKMGLGGMMVWSVETDDFKGKCGERYPLLKTVNRVLNGHAMPSMSQPSPSLDFRGLWSSSDQKSQIRQPPGPQIMSTNPTRPMMPMQGPSIGSQGMRVASPSWNTQQGALSAPNLPPLAPVESRLGLQNPISSQSLVQDPQKAVTSSTPSSTPPAVGQTSSTPGVPKNIIQVPDKDGLTIHLEDSEEIMGPPVSVVKNDVDDEDEPMPNPSMSTEAPQKMTSNHPETSTKSLETMENQKQGFPQNKFTPSSGFTGWNNEIQNSKLDQDSMKEDKKDNKAGPPKSPESSPKPPMRETVQWPPKQVPPHSPQNPWLSPQIPPQTPQIPQRPLFIPSIPPQSPGMVMLVPQDHIQGRQGSPFPPPGSLQSPQGPPMVIPPGPPLGSQVILHEPWPGQPGFVQSPQMFWPPQQVIRNSPINGAHILPASTSLLQVPQQPQHNMLVHMPKPDMGIPETQSASDPLDKIGLCKGPGFIRDPNHCNIFYKCQSIGGQFRIHKFDCPPTLKFNPSINGCDHAREVQC